MKHTMALLFVLALGTVSGLWALFCVWLSDGELWGAAVAFAPVLVAPVAFDLWCKWKGWE